MGRIAQDTGMYEHDSSIPRIGSKDNPIKISNIARIHHMNVTFVEKIDGLVDTKYIYVDNDNETYYYTIV